MIIDLQRFVAVERPYWAELEARLDKLEREPNLRMSLEELRRFHFLFERTAADLRELDRVTSEIAVAGDRNPPDIERMTYR